jgi:hypothetical protein
MARYDDTFVDRFLEPWNRHDVDGALALMTDDCVWEVTRGREPHGTLYTGQTAVRSAIVEAFKALPDVNYQPVLDSFGEDRCLHMMDAGDDALTDGFHSFEADNSFRWTNGDTTLPPKLFRGVEGPLELSLYVSATTRYLDDGKPHAA